MKFFPAFEVLEIQRDLHDMGTRRAGGGKHRFDIAQRLTRLRERLPTIAPDFGSRPRIAERNRNPPARTPGTIPSIRSGASGD